MKRNEMANQNMQYVQGPKMDWTEDAGLHQRFKDWREEVELLMDTVLSHIRNADTQNEVCNPLGREGGQDIPQHSGGRPQRQSKNYIGHS